MLLPCRTTPCIDSTSDNNHCTVSSPHHRISGRRFNRHLLSSIFPYTVIKLIKSQEGQAVFFSVYARRQRENVAGSGSTFNPPEKRARRVRRACEL